MLLAVATCFIFFASLLLLTQYSRASGKTKSKILSSEIMNQKPQNYIKNDYIIPNLIGEKYSSISDDNIIKTKEEYNDDFNEGYVISQSIPPGSRKSGNEMIEVTVSKGTANRVLPNIEGKTLGNVTNELYSIGFKSVAINKIACDMKNNTVIGYSNGLKPGDVARVDQKIAINLAVI